MKYVNQPVRKKDAMQLVTGQPVYVDDIAPKDCLIVKLLRSPYANAMVTSVNKAAAMKVDGIEAIYTWEDIPQDGRRYTQAVQTYPEPSPYDRLLIDRHVRFVGDVVAIVAGRDEKCVDKALKLIKVQYEVLEPLLDFRKAKDNPILVHPEENWESLVPVGADNRRNLCAHDETGSGDVEEVLKNSEIVIDRVYHTKACQQTMMETFRTFCTIDTYGRLNVVSSTQIVFHCRRIISNALHIPKTMIRVSKPRIGGGFGAKQTSVSEVYPAYVTWMTKKPSKIIFSREESMIASTPRHEMEIHVRVGADKNGIVNGIDMYTLSNTGAYGEHGPTTVGLSGHKSIPLYGKAKAFRFVSDVVYTNHMSAGAYRGYGATQGLFAVESAVNELAAKLHMESQGEKLEQAREKLAKQKPPKKPGPVKRIGRVASGSVHSFVHGKIFEVEQENVGTEGAHRSELVGETALRHGSRFVRRKVREHPAKVVRKAEARYTKYTADYHFHTAAQEHPELTKNALTRYWQKQRLRRQYRKQAKEAAKQSAAAAGKTATATERLTARAVEFVKSHPAGAVIAVLCVLLLFAMQSCSSTMLMLGNAGAGALGASTYPCEDRDMLAAEAAYCVLEDDLQHYLDTYESTHDYDEYHFDLDEIEHDPYVLLSLLCALHEGQWTIEEVQGTLQMLFDRQYILTEDVVVETRYRTETDTWTDEDGNSHTDTYQVPYDYYICTVTLENFDLSHVPVYVMGEDQLSRYAIYMATLGNRPDLFPDSPYVNKYITGKPGDYEVPGEYLDDETFAAMLAEAQKYIGYPYVWGGSSPATSFDCSGYVSWVINHSGWNVGRLGAQGLYNICTPTSSPKPGDLVFFKGTYDTPGVSHCGIYVGDGKMLHCGDPIGYANLNTSYWQSHFYAYGRLP